VTIPRQLLEELADNTGELIELLSAKRKRTTFYESDLKKVRAILDA
jgi:hypothetical protein